MKIQFNHKAESMCESLGLPRERITEIKDALYNKATTEDSSFNSKSDLIEQVINELNIVDPAELFVLGTVFGVMDYFQDQKVNVSDEIKTMIESSDVSPMLNVDKFKKAMKDGEQDF